MSHEVNTMKLMTKITALLITALGVGFGPVNAQERMLSFDLRGAYALPLGDFSDNVNADWGFGAGAVVSLTNSVGIYGAYSQDSFDCDNLLCSPDAKVDVSGFEVGAKFILPTEGPVLPWLKAGLIGHTVEFEGDAVRIESDRHYGFQAAVGLDYPLGRVLSVSPAIRLNLVDNDDEGFFEQPEVNYVSFDIGAHIHIPRN